MDERVRWGILGTGKIARILATALNDSQDGELVSVGSRDAERAGQFAAEFGSPRCGSYDEVVQDPAVDLVYVGIHHPLHREWAVQAAEAGKHILCEKPMALRHSDAAEIVDAARRNDVFLLEAFAYRCHPQTQLFVNLLRGGRIGELRIVDAVFGYDAGPNPRNYLFDRDLGGGGILDVGCYTSSMAHLVAAAAAGVRVVQATEVQAAGRISRSGVDVSSGATLVFEGGQVLARVACSLEANLESSVRVYGSEGRLTVMSPWLPGRIGTQATVVLERWGSEPQVFDIPVATDVYTSEVDAVNGLVLKGERSPSAMTWEDSLANMATLDRWRSAIGVTYAGDETA